MSRGVLLEERAQPVRNLVTNPRATGGAWVASSTSGQISTDTHVTSGGPTGGTFFRRSFTAASTGSLQSSDMILVGGGPAVPGVSIGSAAPVAAGQRYALSVWVRSSVAQTVHVQAQWLVGAGSAGSSQGPDTTLVPGVWTRLSVVAVAPLTALAVRLDIDGGAGYIPWQVGDTLDATMAMITLGSTVWVYADGDTPGWRWTGTPGASASVGWPYTLERLVGRAPLLVTTTAGIQTIAAADAQPTAGLTLLVFFDWTGSGDGAGPAARR